MAEKVKREVSNELYHKKLSQIKPNENTKASALRRKSALAKLEKHEGLSSKLTIDAVSYSSPKDL